MSYFNKKSFTMRQVVGLLTVVFLGIAVIAYAAVTVPNSFTSGATISSSQVNANFTALGNAMPAVKTVNTSYTEVTTTTATNIMSLVVTPPVNGYIILTGSGSLGINQSVAGYSNITVYLTTISGGNSDNQTFHVLQDSSIHPYSWVPLHVQGIFPVTGGTPTTFYLTAAKGAVTANYAAYVGGSIGNDTQLTALFVPGTALP